MRCHLLFDGNIGGILDQEGAVIILCVKVLFLVDDIALLVGLYLPLKLFLAGGLIDLLDLLPDLDLLDAVLIIPEDGGELADCNDSRGLKYCSVGTGILCGNSEIAAERGVRGKGGGSGFDPAYLSGICDGSIVCGYKLNIPCEVAALVGNGASFTLHEHGHIRGYTEAEGAGCFKEGDGIGLNDGNCAGAAYLIIIK